MTLEPRPRFDLDIGFDLTNPHVPVPFLYGSSQSSVGVKLSGVNLDFKAAAGPIGIQVVDGEVAIDSDGLADNNTADVASVSIGLQNFDANGRLYFRDLGLEDLTAPAITGIARINLPIKNAAGTAPLDPSQPNLSWQFDFSDLGGDIGSPVVPNFSAIFDNANLSTSLDVMSEGWDGLLEFIDRAVDAQAFIARLPIVGDQLQEASRFITQLRDKIRDNLSTAGQRSVEFVRQKVYEAIGPGGLKWLKDGPDAGSDVSVSDIATSPANPTLSTSEVFFEMELGQSATLVELPIGFDLGIDGLGLDLDGNVSLKTGFNWHLKFGVSRADGLFLDTSRSDELSFFIQAGMPNLNVTGSLGFLQVQATDNPSNPSGINATFIVNLKDPNNDGRLTLAETAQVSEFSQVVDARLGQEVGQNQAGVHLQLVASFAGETRFPTIRTDLDINWSFAGANATASLLGNAPSVAFNNITVDPGQIVRGFLGPIIDEINSVLDPIRPVLQVLESPLPVVSQLAGRPFTLLDIAELYGYLPAGTRDFIRAANKLLALADQAKTIASSGYSLGSYVIAGPGTTDLRTGSTTELNGETFNNSTVNSPGGTAAFVNSASELNTASGGGFQMPILQKPSTILNLLFGKNVPLFTYQMPTLTFDAGFFQVYPVFPPFVNVVLAGSIGARASFGFGFDTFGLMEFVKTGDIGKVFDGFYVSDRINADGTGRDIPELTLSGSFEVAAAAGGNFGPLTILIGAIGGLYAELGFNLNDPDGDGRVRVSELIDNARQGLDYIFDVEGGFTAALSVFALLKLDLGITTLTILDVEKEIANATLLDFTTNRTANAVNLGSRDNNGRLSLNLTEGDDVFIVRRGANATQMIVSSAGRSQVFNDVTSILADGRGGNDTITIESTVTLPATIYGRAGNDKITLGAGGGTAYGGTGDDLLIGGAARDVLRGEQGNDILRGNAGNDELDGDEGDDQLSGAAGDDILRGGPGRDTLTGDVGSDSLFGGAGNDSLDGGLDNDTLMGDQGDDRLVAGDGADLLRGGADNDVLDGGLGNDSLFGDAGDDVIRGGRSNDSLSGGDGQDTLYGDEGTDSIDGDAGNDLIIAGTAQTGGDVGSLHTLRGGTGDDTIYGDIGIDTLDGGLGNDVLYGLAGADLLIGGWGQDRIFGGINETGADSTSNTIYGDVQSGGFEPGAHDDLIFADRGNDTIDAGPGDDWVYGLAGDDLAFGGDGSDHIFGDAGNDFIVGQAGSDILAGGVGEDVLWGGFEVIASAVFRTQGFDYPTNFPGQAWLELAQKLNTRIVPVSLVGQSVNGSADDGDDTLMGQEDNDWLFGGGGVDLLQGGAGVDFADGGAGLDRIEGGDGDDVLRGGANDDQLLGGPGLDQLFGDEGQTTCSEIAAMAMGIAKSHKGNACLEAMVSTICTVIRTQQICKSIRRT